MPLNQGILLKFLKEAHYDLHKGLALGVKRYSITKARLGALNWQDLAVATVR